MNHDEDGATVRFFQWVDDNGHYTDKSIRARLITRPSRVIRHEESEEALEQTELDELSSGTIVRAKWFVPSADKEYYRLPARIMPHVKLEKQHDLLKVVKRLDLGAGDVERKRRIIDHVRRDPIAFRGRLRKKIRATNGARSRLKSAEIEQEEADLEREIRDLESKINTIDGLTSTTTESIRLKYNQDCQIRRESANLRANIVFADMTETR